MGGAGRVGVGRNQTKPCRGSLLVTYLLLSLVLPSSFTAAFAMKEQLINNAQRQESIS